MFGHTGKKSLRVKVLFRKFRGHEMGAASSIFKVLSIVSDTVLDNYPDTSKGSHVARGNYLEINFVPVKGSVPITRKKMNEDE